MTKIKQTQDQDQVETKEQPAALAGPALAVEANAAKPANKEIGLRSQGDVGKQGPKPAAKTEPAAAEGETAVEHGGPGNLRSQGAVALTKKAEPAEFSNRHMRSELATKAETSKPEPAKAASATPKSAPASKLSKDKSKSRPNAPTLDATAIALKADLKAVKADPIVAPKSDAKLETVTPTISLKVAVKLDEATLVMNPKSEVKLDDAAAAIAPKSDVKEAKLAPSTQPKVEIKKDKATPVKDLESAVDAAKAAPAATPKVEVKMDKKEAVKASKTEAQMEKSTLVPKAPPSAPEPSGATEAEPEKADPIAGDEEALDGMDLQDTTERAQKTGSLSERRHRRTRELRTHKETAAEKPA